MREGIGVSQVDRVLITPRQLVSSQHPLRMLPRHERVETHHLGLHPETELHAEFMHAVDQRVQTVRVALRVDDPVAEGARGVDAADHPPVVEHETFGADGCCELSERG